ncbi:MULTISPECIES: ribonucleotide-diphosphate reductase subunit beta [Leuconostoc]|uniref:ribonucleotide-diphosphate reductase subunit beta n=1 Tax=Leuconostoc TaxID=1243 RepID=UPI00030A2173|nr:MULTISPECIES: ribonucleotide-diphosphate reductase subunit beta [Leuconostoc]KAA8345756.1 ribonucleoside-diphosphate reductase [Leuconostoc mesenteroides]MBB6433555.1 ribonucleoside-diphosphate reductase beta chain [Leuconostoc carnosum]
MSYLYYEAINWDNIQDTFDKYVWEALTSHFWLDTRIPVTEDVNMWEHYSDYEKSTIAKMLASTSLISAYQSESGIPSIRHDRITKPEEAVYNTITFMKSVHAKSTTTIFRELLPNEGSKYFNWADSSIEIQREFSTLSININDNYSSLKRKFVSILFETGLLFGKYYEILEHQELRNSNKIISSILRGNSIFSIYIGYKFQLGFNKLNRIDKNIFLNWVEDTINNVIKLEEHFLQENSSNPQSAIELVHYGVNYMLTSLNLEQKYIEIDTESTKYLEQILVEPKKFIEQEKVQINGIDNIEDMDDQDYDF